MGVFVEKTQEQGGSAAQPPDPRLTPTPDYGTLSPESDFAKSSDGLSATSPTSAAPAPAGSRSGTPKNLRLFPLVAMMGGIVSALLVLSGGAAWEKITAAFSAKNNRAVSSAKHPESDLDRQKPQKQAETLLARAVSRSDGPTDEIQSHVE